MHLFHDPHYLSVLVPHRLSRTLFQKRVSDSANFDFCKNALDVFSVNICLIPTYLVQLISKCTISFSLLRKLIFKSLLRGSVLLRLWIYLSLSFDQFVFKAANLTL